MKTRIKFITIFLLFNLTSFSQTFNIKGTITDESDIPILANVLLTDEQGVFVKGIATGETGVFLLSDVLPGNYQLIVSSLGFKSDTVSISLLKDDMDLGTIQLTEDETLLEEIIITANSIQSFGVLDRLTIPTAIRNTSSSALDAIAQLPQFNQNALTNTLQTVDMKSIKILINDVNATENDLITLSAKDILRIEYYTEPPARYANLNIGAVINIITVAHDKSGMSVVFNTKNSFTTGYGTNTVNAKFYDQKQQLDVAYFIDYRNLSDNRINQEFDYNIDNTRYRNEYIGLPGTYKGEYHIFQTKYIYEQKDNYTLSSKLSYRINPGREQHTQESIVQIDNQTPSTGEASKSLKSNYNSLSGDLYFAKNLKNNQEVIANIVGTHFNSTSDNLLSHIQQDATGNYSYQNYIENKSMSVILEALYNKRFENKTFSIGSRYFYKNQFQNYNDEQETALEQQVAYLYSGLTGSKDKISYNVELGAEYTLSSYEGETNKNVDFLTFKPLASLTYAFDNRSSLRLNSGVRSTVPDISYFTTNPVYLNYNYYSIGNPSLKPYYTFFSQLQYQLNMPKLYFSTSTRYSRLFKPFLITFKERDNQIIQIRNVQKEMSYYGIDVNSRWTPSNWISLQCYLSLVYSEFTSNNHVRKDDLSKMGSFSATFMYRDFKFLSQFGTSFTNLYGDYVEKRNAYYIGEFSWLRDSFTAALQYIHNPNPSVIYSNSSIINFREETRWNNFKNLFVVRLVYTFSGGKQNAINQKQKISNIDNDSGLREETKAK